MSTMKSHVRKKQNWRTAKKVSSAKKQMGGYRSGGIYRSGAKWYLKESADCHIPGSTSRYVVVRDLSPRSHSDVYKILASQEKRELDNAISTLRRAILDVTT